MHIGFERWASDISNRRECELEVRRGREEKTSVSDTIRHLDHCRGMNERRLQPCRTHSVNPESSRSVEGVSNGSDRQRSTEVG